MEEIIELVRKKCREDGVSFYKLAQETGISKEKLYKWFNPRVAASPKSGDVELLRSWLAGTLKIPRGTNSKVRLKKKPRGERGSDGFLIDAGAVVLRSEAKIDVLLSAVAQLIAAASKRNQADVLEELEEAVRSRIDEMEAGSIGL